MPLERYALGVSDYKGLVGPGEVFQLGVDVGANRASRQAPDPGRTRRPSRVHYAVAMTRKRNAICFQLFRQIGPTPGQVPPLVHPEKRVSLRENSPIFRRNPSMGRTDDARH
jgi:hypothetical protein